MAAGHGASGQTAHVLGAIPGGIRTGRRLAVMMLWDRAVVPCTASHASNRPSGNGKGSVQQYNRQQAETSRDDWPAIWNPSAQGVHVLVPDNTSKYSTAHGICWTSGHIACQRASIAASRTAQRRRLALT